MEKREIKSFAFAPEMTKVIDGDQGVVEHIVAVMGNVDDGGDIIHPGAFTKTIMERMGKVRVLDQHRTDSISHVLGKPISMRELGRSELPQDLLLKYPAANGALLVQTQYLLDTPEGAGAFKRIKAGAIDEYSIGYDVLDKDYSEITIDGEDQTVRNLRTLRLWEYSPVLWGMNAATRTLSAKGKVIEDMKPYGIFRSGDMWQVFKVDENGEATGEMLGEHETEREALDQVRALYEAEPGAEKQDEKISDIQALKEAVESATEIMSTLADLIKSASDLIDEKEQQAGPDTPPPTSGDDDIDRHKLLDEATLEQVEIELATMEV